MALTRLHVEQEIKDYGEEIIFERSRLQRTKDTIAQKKDALDRAHAINAGLVRELALAKETRQPAPSATSVIRRKTRIIQQYRQSDSHLTRELIDFLNTTIVDYLMEAADTPPDTRRSRLQSQVKSLLEDLLNRALIEADPFVRVKEDSELVRFLVRAGICTFHPSDAYRIRMINFAN